MFPLIPLFELGSVKMPDFVGPMGVLVIYLLIEIVYSIWSKKFHWPTLTGTVLMAVILIVNSRGDPFVSLAEQHRDVVIYGSLIFVLVAMLELLSLLWKKVATEENKAVPRRWYFGMLYLTAALGIFLLGLYAVPVAVGVFFTESWILSRRPRS